MEQGMSWREERETGNVMEKMAWKKECHVGKYSEQGMDSKGKAWHRECHGGRNVEQGMTWRE
jgi:hypothetical protein